MPRNARNGKTANLTKNSQRIGKNYEMLSAVLDIYLKLIASSVKYTLSGSALAWYHLLLQNEHLPGFFLHLMFTIFGAGVNKKDQKLSQL